MEAWTSTAQLKAAPDTESVGVGGGVRGRARPAQEYEDNNRRREGGGGGGGGVGGIEACARKRKCGRRKEVDCLIV